MHACMGAVGGGGGDVARTNKFHEFCWVCGHGVGVRIDGLREIYVFSRVFDDFRALQYIFLNIIENRTV